MARKKESLVLYLTKEEKESLIQKAKEAGSANLNAYIKSIIFSENANKSELLSLIGMFKSDELLDSSVERNHLVKTSLSEQEYQYVKKAAGNSSISAFVRKTLLNANSGKFIFEIKTGDISELRKSLSEFNMRMEGIIGALRYRSELYSSDINGMRNLLDEANENIKKCLSVIMTDRKYVRKKSIRHLEEQIDKILLTVTEKGETVDDGNM